MPTWLAPWEWSSSDWAGLQFVVLVAAAIVALRQVREARQLRLERSRPFVVIDLDVWRTSAEFKITNIGATLAYDVRFEFEPPLETTQDGMDRPALRDVNLFKNGIPSLPPGKEIVVLFDDLPARIEAGLPDEYVTRVSYYDPLGTRHSETMSVGYGFLRETGRVHRRDIHDVNKQLEEIANELQKWTAPTRHGVLAMTPATVRESWQQDKWRRAIRRGPRLRQLYSRARLWLRRV